MSQQKASSKRGRPPKEAGTPQQPTNKSVRTSVKAAAARQEIVPLPGTESMSLGWKQLYNAISKEAGS
jgi:hypothetical protein